METIDINILSLIYAFVQEGPLTSEVRLISKPWNKIFLSTLGDIETMTFSEQMFIGKNSSIIGLEDQLIEFVNRYYNVVRLSIYGFKKELYDFVSILAKTNLSKKVEILFVFTAASPNHRLVEALDLKKSFPNLRKVWLWNKRITRLLNAGDLECVEIPKSMTTLTPEVSCFCEWYEMTGELLQFWDLILRYIAGFERIELNGYCMRLKANNRYLLPKDIRNRTKSKNLYALDYLDAHIFNFLHKNVAVERQIVLPFPRTIEKREDRVVNVFGFLLTQGYTRFEHCLELAKVLDKKQHRPTYEKGLRKLFSKNVV
jgi:hypothetical protein